MTIRFFAVWGLTLLTACHLSTTSDGDSSGGGGGPISGSSSGSQSSGGGEATLGCDGPLFVDTIAEAAWTTLDVDPGGGTAGIRDAVVKARDEYPNVPVRVRLSPGNYADTLGSEIYVQRIQRSASAPVWIVAADPTPNATQIGQGFNFVGIAYVALEGVTVGPASVGAFDGTSHAEPKPGQASAGVHVAGAAKQGNADGAPGGALDKSVYGQFEPSHHVILRHLTIQNLFGDDDPSGEFPVGQDHDGTKLNQTSDAWVIGNTVTQTSRHGMDNVGVHRVFYCGNVIAHNGAGQGIEAKGGSVDVVYESNVFVSVRRVSLGGENTDAAYYWSDDGAYSYEAKGLVARNNLIVNPRETAFDFASCHGCSVVNNTVVFTSDYIPPLTDDGEANGGDAIRYHDSVLLGADEGAGSDCVTWDENAKDYVTVDNCWNVGSHAPAPIGNVLTNEDNLLVDNLFVSHAGTWSTSFGSSNPSPSTIPCPFNASGSVSGLSSDFNFWFNGGKPLPLDACSPIDGGAHSLGWSTLGADPAFATTTLDGSTIASIRTHVLELVRPAPSSAVVGSGTPSPRGAIMTDFAGAPRPIGAWTIGALEP